MLEYLRLVYAYVENAVISCGAPDTFDVYEAAFEALAKMGFFFLTAEPKQLLLQTLENVNEVYDVLLSCVETYEWVQPGTTGLLRLWMLQVLFACFGQAQISGRDLMVLTDNDVSGAVSLIAFLVRCDSAPFEMQDAAGRCLVELTAADSVFLNRTGDEATNTEQIAILTAMLNKHVNGLIKGLIQFEIVEAFGRCICQHQQSHLRTDIIVRHFLTTIHNCLLYCSEHQKKLRQHLATQSTIVQDIMIPYIHNILPALFDNPCCGPANIEFQNLKSVLQTFVVVTFNINIFRPHIRDADLLVQVCRVPNIMNHISMVELLIKLAINVDFASGPYADSITAALQSAFSAMPPDSQARLQRRLTSEQGMRLPYARSAVKSVQALAFATTPEAEDPGAAAERKTARKNNWKNAKHKGKKRKRMFGMQAKAKNANRAPEDADESEEGNGEEDDSGDDDMPPLIPAENWEQHLGQTDESYVPSMAKCQLTGALMHDPVKTPDGYLFERAALEDWLLQNQTNPLTGAPLVIADCIEATDVAAFIQGYQMQMFAASHIAPEAFEEPPCPEVAPPEAAAPTPMPAPAPMPSSGSGTLLGDLPTLTPAAEAPKKKDKGKIRIESRSVVDCPPDMRCSIDGKVMINPVRSPYGHFFEKKTLDKWILNCGSVCPVTQQPLRGEDCLADPEMKKRIIKFLKGQP